MKDVISKNLKIKNFIEKSGRSLKKQDLAEINV